MTIQRVPPPPTSNNDQGIWGVWYTQVKDAINTIGTSLKWTSLDFTGSKLTDILSRNHSDLLSLQGGTATQYYHLTLAQHTDLTDAGDSTSHYHASDRARANHTGTQLLATISDAGTAASQSGLTVVITTAPVTGGGVAGSMTFTNGVLTAQVQAT